jgi:DNA polymerase
MILWLDLETYCEMPINHGTHAYAEQAEVILTQYAVDDDAPVVKEGLAEELPMLIDMADAVWICSKDGFDRIILKYQGIVIPLEKCFDVATQALCHGLPAGLDKLGKIMGLPEELQKKDGKALIQLFCKPRPKNAKLRRATKETHPVEWARFVEYGGSDILAMREVQRKLPRINYPDREHQLWCLNERINDRGMRVDLGLARAAITTVAEAKKIMDERTQEITDDRLRSTTQRDQLLQLALADYGVSLPDMQASTIERRLEDPDLPAGLRELLALRLQTSTTSNAK